MTINWFSPLPPARTGVATYAGHVLEFLSQAHDVTLWTDQTDVARETSAYGRVMKFRGATPPWRQINAADFSVYHIGNHADFHATILDISRQSPGIVVLHDVRLHDLMYMLFVHARRDREAYLSVLERWHGAEGRRSGEAFCAGGLSSEAMVERFPLTLEALTGALGVVTHTNSLETIGDAPLCPSIVLPHPYHAMTTQAYQRIRDERERRTSPPFQLVVFGFLGRNRRLEPILRGLSESGLQSQFRLEICGDLWDEKRIRKLIEELELTGHVSLRGFLPDADLHRILKTSDLAFNLRYPSMGEASGSLCRLWDYGIPALVTRTQWYATLPPETVGFIRPDHELEDIVHHLEAFLAGPDAYRRLGENGRAELRNYNPAVYARKLVEFAMVSREYSPRLSALRLAERVGDDAGRWLHPYSTESLFHRTGTEIARGFGDSATQPDNQHRHAKVGMMNRSD